MYTVIIEKKAKKDIIEHYESGNKAIVGKIRELLIELESHPQTGTGKPERLKYDKFGLWSRRISGKHRLVYSIAEKIVSVIVISAKGHYD